ncbi:hypothetical protein [Geomesophilobacter sediminis]|uniref:Uncharacterized protein n=1 Tax=Geomesophilobacter sediminis TaxID=2798584 RepID=A0A8J7LXL2_9BACT|nr:hypothetical protein [Geomesophilobacter sediminis]MBJ6723352.1 hypothetical protein [Geomesophilobacter sediminis]
MILAPNVLALLVASGATALLTALAACHGVGILRHWDLSSGSERQLALERRTYLTSALVGTVLSFELLSLFLFVSSADRIAPLLIGAMCAVGTLQANGYGFATLYLKLALFLLSGLWLVLNHADNLVPDYPLIRPKYLLLLVLAPLSAAEAVLEALFFLRLKPDVITSCCGSLFSSAAGTETDLAALPPRTALIALVAAGAALLLCAFWTARSQRRLAPLLLGAAGTVHFAVALAAIISAVSPYVYELPTHHCPFCLLQREYRYVGYLIYPALLAATVTSVGVGALAVGRAETAAGELPRFRRRLARWTIAAELLFLGIVAACIATSQLTLR